MRVIRSAAVPFLLFPSLSLSLSLTVSRIIFYITPNSCRSQLQRRKNKIRKIYTPLLSINGHPQPDTSFGPSYSIRRVLLILYTYAEHQGHAIPISTKCITFVRRFPPRYNIIIIIKTQPLQYSKVDGFYHLPGRKDRSRITQTTLFYRFIYDSNIYIYYCDLLKKQQLK